MPKQKQAPDTGVWKEKVIGTGRIADSSDASGKYGYFESKWKVGDRTATAQVWPDFGTTRAEGGRHLWGVKFPEQDRKTTYDPKTDRTIELVPHRDQRSYGGHAPDAQAAMRAAEDCIRLGGPPALPTNDNGTLKALEPDWNKLAASTDPDDAPFGTAEDVPEDAF